MEEAASSSAKAWRTAFLTLRDETLTSPRVSIPKLLQHLIFTQSHSLVAAAPNLPPHEVTSDVMFLVELAATSEFEDSINAIINTCYLIHEVSRRVSLEINSSYWDLMLDSLGKMVDFLLYEAGTKRVSPVNTAGIGVLTQCLDTIRYLMRAYHKKCSLHEHVLLMKFLLRIVALSHAELSFSCCSSGIATTGKGLPQYCGLWDIQTTAFTMIGEVLSRVGPSLPFKIWQSTVEVLRKVMDVLASRSLLVEDSIMSRFYASLLHCLHLVLADPKDSLSDHVAGFVAALRMFLIYGLPDRPQPVRPLAGYNEKKLSSRTLELNLEESRMTDCGPYRPPHLRKKDSANSHRQKAWQSQGFSDHESSLVDFTSSDSDYSDSDTSAKDTDCVQSSKARVAAINCIQDLCQADPKSFSAQWTMLLPTSDVLQPRKYEATLMTCLLFDPFLKARTASASTLVSMLDGPSSVFLCVAEYKESTKCGAFTALSNALGQILMQLHTGVLYLIKCETHCGLLASLFKILTLLIKSTPYSRMPVELLPTVITFLCGRIEEGFTFKSDQNGLMVLAISCLAAAFSTSPSSLHVKAMLLKEISTGHGEAQGKPGVLLTLFQYSGRVANLTVSFEALQALRVVSHSYPSIMVACWEQVSAVVYGFFRLGSLEVSTRSWKGHDGNPTGSIGEKVITAAIKVLDECLRAISGFKGTEDISDDRLLETPFTSDCIRTRKISSAPSYGVECVKDAEHKPNGCCPGIEQWHEAMDRHIPLILQHNSAMIDAGVSDEVPLVRSAACRAIGVIVCFPQISQSAEILHKFSHAAELNTHDPLVSVRTAASWALANICDSLSRINDEHLEGSSSQLVVQLTECALRLTKDGDKIKSNAVRALGNLSRFVQYQGISGAYERPNNCMSLALKPNGSEMLPLSSELKVTHNFLSSSHHPACGGDSDLLDRMVQAFLSCVTTGNVKVQWNVCHALSNLFLNKKLRLQDLEWAPSVFNILLLLLRDSSNFKIRIQAAVALAVPFSVHEYGRSYSDIVQGLQRILENMDSDQIPTPSSFKYMVMLKKQLTSTMLHVLSLASGTEHEPPKDFLVKKASFFEEWFKVLCSSLGTVSEADLENQKKEMITRAIQSLIEVYEGRNNKANAERFKSLVNSMQ
ncbi:uncharacterized protein LOC131158794 isoform X2 [Malania oleifera]|uniref:uncharacterized protein LOC131158794 isoform X2 n=1 Tax=Malania oleifera TaxID=397392 RepID=UPI0025ADFD6D|nr:uncharacterized protein LOC131158794 isoform X2 [Malania oleifera]